MSDLVLSKSSVNAYLTCPLQWWFTYVAAMPGEPNDNVRLGIAVHDLVEKTLTSREPQSWQSTDKETRSLVALWEKEVWPTVGSPKYIEQQFIIEVDGIPFSGYIDYVTEGHILCDLKTTLKRPKAGKYRFDSIGYWLGLQTLGFDPIAIRLDYLVRTKTPYYLPEMQDIPEDWEVAAFASTLTSVRRDIETGLFPPTGLEGYACKYCQHRSICGPYAAMPQKESNSADA